MTRCDRRTEGEGRVLATAATALAVSAVKVHGAFVRHDIETDQLIAVDPDAASVQAALTAAQLDKG
jgi:hypothetical protein